MEKEQNQNPKENILSEKENAKTDSKKDTQDSGEQNIKNKGK